MAKKSISPGVPVAGLKRKFKDTFGHAPDAAVAGPGRVNIIGEHTDYNEGFVLPAAIDREVIILASPRTDRMVNLYSSNYDESSSFSLEAITHDDRQSWSNYERGMADVLQKAGFALSGAEMLIYGNVPLGAGLSSSAAVEVAAGAAFRSLFGLEIPDRTLALLGQKAENEFVGMRCGIMDQFASCLSRKNSLLFLDCRSLDIEYVPLPDEDISIVLCNTNVPRRLVGSEYNRRRSECESAVAAIGKHEPEVKSLRDVSPEMLDRYASGLAPLPLKRARHVIEENRRVLQCVEHLRHGSMTKAAALLNASHESLRDEYEVSVRELDVMAEIAWSVDGVLGARMMGGGFGGCTINLVKQESVDALRAEVEDKYLARTGYKPDIFICRASGGVRAIDLN